jgi:hypothetical protein
MAKFYVKQNQQIVREYRTAGGPWPARKIDIAEWALANDKWEMSREDKLRACANAMADAMSQEYMTDDTGRRVRLKHVARMKVDGEQGSWWGDIRTMPLDHMQVAVAFRRRGIVAECRQMSNDVRYFNTLHSDWEPIQLVLDFTRDVQELDQGRKDHKAA